MRYYSLIFLAAYFLTGKVADALGGDDDLDKKLRNLVISYLECYTLSGTNGRYDHMTEQKFRELFSENAAHFNFLPGTRYYSSDTNLEEYCEGLKEFYNQHIIHPVISDYKIENIRRPLPADVYIAEVSIINSLHIYSDNTNPGLDTVVVNIMLEIYADLLSDNFKIVNVRNNERDFLNLSFQFVNTNREPVTHMPVRFSYTRDNKPKKINRLRYSDYEGSIHISTIPHDALLSLGLPRGYSFALKEKRTVAEWDNIPPEERMIFIKQNRLTNRSWISFGINHHVHLNELYYKYSSVSQPKNQVNFSSLNPGYYFNYAFLIMDRKSFGLAIGTGINYSVLAMLSEYEIYQYLFYYVNSDEVITPEPEVYSDVVKEYNNYESWDIPAFLTFRYKTNKKYLHSVDLTANVNYSFSQALHNESHVTQTLKSNSENHKAYNPYKILNSGQDIFITQPEVTSLSRKIKQDYPLHYGINLSFNIPVLHNRLWFQAGTSYQLLFLGNDSAQSMEPVKINNNYTFIPALANRQQTIGSLRAGFGFLYNF